LSGAGKFFFAHPLISRSHALAWECLGDAPASRDPQKLDAGASRMGDLRAAKLTSFPTPARGNQKNQKKNLPLKDFEDALQCAVALTCGADVIVTRKSLSRIRNLLINLYYPFFKLPFFFKVILLKFNIRGTGCKAVSAKYSKSFFIYNP